MELADFPLMLLLLSPFLVGGFVALSKSTSGVTLGNREMRVRHDKSHSHYFIQSLCALEKWSYVQYGEFNASDLPAPCRRL